MFMKPFLLVILTSIALAACGGSGDTSPTATTTTPTSNPPPVPTPTPAPPSIEGIFFGQAVIADDGSTAKVLSVVSADMDALIVVGDYGAMLKVNLTVDANGNISQEGLSYWDDGVVAKTVEVAGTGSSEGYTLEILEEGIKQFDVTLLKNDTISNLQPVVNGYYELDAEKFEKTGLVINDGNIEGNDTAHCKYTGSYIPVASNVLAVNIMVTSIEPLSCALQGDYEGLATTLTDDASLTGEPELWVAVHNSEYAIVRPLSKASDEPEFIRFPAGLYYQDSTSEFEDISFAVSHDGQMRGAMFNKQFAGFFNAVPNYMGKGYAVYDDQVLFYDKSAWHTVKGNFSISDSDWERIFAQPQAEIAERSFGDFADIIIGVSDEPKYTGTTSMAITKKIRDDFPIQFSDLVGRYVVEGGPNIDLTIQTDGTFSGKHHGCEVTGQITERTDTPAQEFAVTFTRANCPGSNNFSLDGRYEGFGFASNFADEGFYKLDLFLSGFTSKGQTTNLITLSSLAKQ